MKKPKHCDQNWLDMHPVEGGRLCGKCEKKIIDFTGMSWAEIMRVQRENGFAACGMYSPKQLKHWGKEVPKPSCEKWLKAAVITAAMAIGSSGNAQVVDTAYVNSGIEIRGTVFGVGERTFHEPLPMAKVVIKENGKGVLTDMDGQFVLKFGPEEDWIKACTLEVSSLDYDSFEIPIQEILRNGQGNASEPLKITLEATELHISHFYVDVPSKRELRKDRKARKAEESPE